MADTAAEEAALESPRLSDEDLVLEEGFEEEVVVDIEPARASDPQAAEEEAMEVVEEAPSEPHSAAPVIEQEEAPAEESGRPAGGEAAAAAALAEHASAGIRINFSVDDDTELEDELAEVEECGSGEADETTRFAPGWMMKKPFSSLAPIWFKYQNLTDYQRKVVHYTFAVGTLVVVGTLALVLLFLLYPGDEGFAAATQGKDKFAYVTASNGVVAGDCERVSAQCPSCTRPAPSAPALRLTACSALWQGWRSWSRREATP